MTLQTLVSAVKEDTAALASKMNLESDAILINQCEENSYSTYEYKGKKIDCYHFCEKGVGLSRNNALMRATADIVLFSDEDIVYETGYAEKILGAFAANPDADMLLFNMEVDADRATYYTKEKKRVHWYNCGRYPTYSFALRREKLHRSGITFSLLFGGGAKYSNGEDSLFIRDCLKKGFKIYALPISIGKEVKRPSTWFNGYTEKFFYDRGVLYHFLYGRMAKIFALRFLLKNKNVFFADNGEAEVGSVKEAYRLMKSGIKEMR